MYCGSVIPGVGQSEKILPKKKTGVRDFLDKKKKKKKEFTFRSYTNNFCFVMRKFNKLIIIKKSQRYWGDILEEDMKSKNY